MQNKDWRGLAELIGIAAIVASLFFVGLQIRQSQDVALSELDVALNANDIALATTIGDHADIWVNGNAGAELDASELAYYSRLITGMHGWYQTSWRRNTRFGRENVAIYNAVDFAIFLHNNPGAKHNWMSRREPIRKQMRDLGLTGGGSGFSAAVRASLDKLAESQD